MRQFLQYLGHNFLATPGLHVTTFHNLATALRKYGSKGKRRDRNRCYEDETQSVFEIIVLGRGGARAALERLCVVRKGDSQRTLSTK